MRKKGILIVISGFSGTGKGTVMKRLMHKYEKSYALSISATTREPREGEMDGVDYFFKTREEFEQMIAEDALIEYARYIDHYYGTPRSYVEQQLNAGRDVILEIEIQGALNVKEQFPDTLLLFLSPPSAEELKRRLINRGTEDMATIKARLQRAFEESVEMDQYDYVVINDKLEDCVDQVHAIVCSEHSRLSHNQSFIHQIRAELSRFSKGEEI